MQRNLCPTTDELQKYTFGKLHRVLHESVERHLDLCEKCQATLTTISDSGEPLFSALRRGPIESQFVIEPEFKRGIELVHEIARDWPRDGGPATLVTIPPQLTRIGEYELLEFMKKGGMGAVYKARHVRLGKIVAVKVIASNRVSDKNAVARFEREMRTLGQLQDPGIVAAHDAGEFEGNLFLVMEYVEGHDLAWLVKHRGPLSVPEACELICQAASGLQHAHSQRVVHRDVKPSNLILAADGRVKVLDFGLALLRNSHLSAEELTGTGIGMGTADYMAPEQAQQPHDVDIRADIYSLGCTLYELIGGHAPFSGPKYGTYMKKVMAHINEPVPPISEWRSGVPVELVRILERMLSKSAAQRFETPASVAQALAPFAVGADVSRLSISTIGKMTVDGNCISEADPNATNGDGDTKRSGIRNLATVVVKTPSPIALPKQRMARRSRLTIFGAIAAALFSIGILYGEAVIHVVTNQGVLIVNVNDPSVVLTVRQNHLVVADRTTQREFTLTAGDGEIEVYENDSGLKLLTKEFTISRGRRKTVTVEAIRVDGSSRRLADEEERKNPSESPITVGSWVIVKEYVAGYKGQHIEFTDKLYVPKGKVGKVIQISKDKKRCLVHLESENEPALWISSDSLRPQ